jgi:phthiocerol/phenolphthiocerol synthesis type-I polyketide synthase E
MKIKKEETYRDLDIAVIGMDCRFPGANNCEEFWENLCKGKKSKTVFTDEELRKAGVSESRINDKHYVKAAYLIEDEDKFDASFFGFTAKEAKLMDPQERLLLETSWHALEDAGYAKEGSTNRIGVFAGKSNSQYLMKNIISNYGLKKVEESRSVWIGNDFNYTATMISYKLNLTGPSINVQSACSTSLLAVAMGCQSLLNYECDIALTGGVRLAVPQTEGYMYSPGEVFSPDGECRPFDAKGNGTVIGSGVGIVALKRLSEAVEDGDQIIAVVKGYGSNNDGSTKVGYAAPSVTGERQAVYTAQLLSEVDPKTITYVEAHGTATELGDPIEIQALTEAFRASTDNNQFCALGMVKANIGHLDTASGIAGFIKTCLVLKHGIIPPCVNYNEPNKNIDLNNSPFYINKELKEWKPECGIRRAGVSSFGIGGTNVHMILEEAVDERIVDSRMSSQMLLLSGKTRNAVEKMAAQLAGYLKKDATADYKNALYSMNIGRKEFMFRSNLVCLSREECIDKLEKAADYVNCSENRENIVFMFPGQGTQYIGMAKDLYANVTVFRKEMDYCSDYLKDMIHYDLNQVLFRSEPSEENQKFLSETQNTHVALFCMEYALAKTLIHLGIKPSAMIGHSIGEYVAACISGVMNLETALTVIARRGRIIQGLRRGAMLSVNLSAKEAEKYCNNQISLAVENTNKLTVLSGETEAIHELAQRIGKETGCRILHTSHAFHSKMMEEGAEEFRTVLQSINWNKPEIPYISNVTGDFIKQEDIMDTEYWIKHLTGKVGLREGSEKFKDGKKYTFFEVGPGNAVSSFMRTNLYGERDSLFYNTLRGAKEAGDDIAFLLQSAANAWAQGHAVDVEKIYEDGCFHKISLPTYPFEKESYWMNEIRSDENTEATLSQKEESDNRKEQENQRSSESLYAAPENELEEILVEMLEEVMELHPIGVTDNFIEIGGHSLIASQVISRIWEKFGVEIKISQFMDMPTIRQVGEFIYDRLLEENE